MLNTCANQGSAVLQGGGGRVLHSSPGLDLGISLCHGGNWKKNLPLDANGNCWNVSVPPAVAGDHTPLGWKVLASPSPSSVGAHGERGWEEAARLWGPGQDQGALPEAELGRKTSAHPSSPWLDPASTLVLWAVLLQGPAKRPLHPGDMFS